MDACTESPAEVKAFALVHISENHKSTILISIVQIYLFNHKRPELVLVPAGAPRLV